MSKDLRKTYFFVSSILLLSLISCTTVQSNKTVYAFQMGKDTADSASFFRISLTLYNSIIDFPVKPLLSSSVPSSTGSSSTESSSNETSSSETSSSETSSSESTTSSSSSVDASAESIDALTYDRSFEFLLVSKFQSTSSSSSEENSSSSETSSTDSSDTSTDSDTSPGNEPMNFDFKGNYAIDPNNYVYFNLTRLDDYVVEVPASLLTYILKAQLGDGSVNVTIPVSFEDALMALLGTGEESYHTVTIALNKE